MAMKEKQQEGFIPKYCEITTERYLISVFYYSKEWQSVTVYEKDGEVAKHKFHGTFAININEELKPYSFYTNNKKTENGILKVTSFSYYVYRTVYDTMRWLEFWKEAEMDEEDKEIAEVLNQIYTAGEVDSELKESVVKKMEEQNEEDEDRERYERVAEAFRQLIADGNVGKKTIFDYLKE